MSANTIALEINGNDIHVDIRRSYRVKRARIIVTAEKVEVVVPHTIAYNNIKHLLNENQVWIARKKLEIGNRLTNLGIYRPYDGSTDATIPLFGEKILVQINQKQGIRPTISVDETITVTLPDDIPEAERNHLASNTLKRWLFHHLGEEIELLVNRHKIRHQLAHRNIRIKEQKTRWGSCGIRNDLHFNWCLVFAPKRIVEYVVVHELCHIKHRNHSSEFWALVGQHLPDFQENRAWLREHGGKLMMVLNPELG